MVLTQECTPINSVLGRSRPQEDEAEQCTAEEQVLSVEKSIWSIRGTQFCGFLRKVEVITDKFAYI